MGVMPVPRGGDDHQIDIASFGQRFVVVGTLGVEGLRRLLAGLLPTSSLAWLRPSPATTSQTATTCAFWARNQPRQGPVASSGPTPMKPDAWFLGRRKKER